jgi:integrase
MTEPSAPVAVAVPEPGTATTSRVDDAAQTDADLQLLRINLNAVRVPKVGGTDFDTDRTCPRYVYDAQRHELVWLTQIVASLRLDGYAADTCDAYTKSFYRAVVVMWALDLDPQHLTAIQWAVVRGWLLTCTRRTTTIPGTAAKPMSLATVAVTESALLTIYKRGLRLGLCSRNPVADLRGDDTVLEGTPLYDTAFDSNPRVRKTSTHKTTITVPTKQIKVVSPEDQERLRNAKRLRDRALWTLCLDTGPRISEALSITPATYFPDQNTAAVVAKGLNGATRDIPISDATIALIAEYLDELASNGWRPAPHDQIFRTLKRPYRPLTYKPAWAALRRATNNPTIHPHALRHTAATNMLDLLDGSEGVRLVTVQLMLGHSNVTTTRKYLHVENRRAINSVVNALTNPRPRSTSGLADTYAPEHIDMLEQIWKEAL